MGPHPSGERRSQPGGATAAQRALIELADAAAPGASLSEVLERVARAAATLVPGSQVHVWLASEDQRELKLVTEIGARPDHGGAEQCRAVPMDESLLGAVVQSPEPVVVPSLLDDERAVSRAWAQHQSVVSFAGVRLARGDRPLGALCLLTWEPYSFTPLEVSFLRSLGAHAAVAIEAVALLEVASTRLRRLETLREIEGGLSAQRDPDALMATISRRAAELLDADRGGIFLLEGQGVLRLHAAFNWPEWMQSVPIPVGEGAIGATAARAQGMVVSDYAHSPLALPGSRDVHRALATQPLMAGGALRGVIVVTRDASPCPFTRADLAILADFAVQASIAIENARLLRLASARAERVKAAAEVGQLLTATRDADKILDLIAEKCREVLGAAAFGLFRFDGDRLRYVRGFGLDKEFQKDHTLAVGEGVVGSAARDRRTVETTDVLRDAEIELSPEARARIESQGSRAIAAVPLLATDRVLGVLAIYHPVGFRLPAEEREFLETLAAHAAVALENAIENARLYDATRHQVEQLERLNHVNRAVSASLRLDDVLDEITRAAGMLCDAPLATVWLADETERILVRRAFHGAREIREQLPDRLAFGQGGVGVVAERREVQLNVPVEANPQIVARETLLAHGVRTFSGLPVMLGDRLLGVLAVSGRVGRLHGPADEALLQALVGQAAVAIQNARLYEEARAHEVEAQRALEELRRTQEQLVRAEKLRALGDMASGVAHDFNNVLAVILGRVQLLQRKVEDSTFRRWLAIVEQAALDGAQTVRQIQEFTRVRRDQPTQTVDLNQAARDAVEATRARWRDESHARGVEIHLALELGAVPPVDGQPLELREVVTNLILNAVDALPHGGQIRIVSREHAGRVEMSVADTGVGMSDAVRRRIFEPFFSTKGPRGTGLGLAMVYGIVSRHGGEVLVNTAEGVGSIFTIRLPVGRLPPSDVARASAPGPVSVRVLVIDDEPFVRETLEEILRLQQHDVVVADDGISGLARFREGAFDLVMTDLAMPGMSGWQVAQAVKAARPQVSVVLVTGWGVEVQADDLKKHGVDRVLTKPFRFDDVRDVLAGVRSA
ncbi:MAG TPA: GAF domain-containing protein [Methylomirabilota bacterium]|nr:GAF domain-containing protein [Methylomirabilota bacterium]